MKIGVLGAGRMAGALAPHWIAAGHDVTIASRTAPRAQALAARIGARAATLREAAEGADALLLAVPHAGVAATLQDAGAADGALAGKPLVDCTNPVETERFTLVTGPGGPSLAEQIARETGAHVAKAFNLVHFHVWERSARYDGRPLVVPIAGDQSAAEVAAQLVRDAGGDPLDAGGLEQAHNLEAMAAVISRLLFRGADPLSAFQLTVGSA